MKDPTAVPILVLFAGLALALAACGSGGVTYLADASGDTAITDVPGPDLAVPEDTLLDLATDRTRFPDLNYDLPPDLSPADLPADLPPADLPPSPCTADWDCDDGDKCTLDRCLDGVCAHDLLPPGFCCADDGDCDDGVACTVDQCLNGACWNLPEDSTCCTKATDCEDFNVCTVDLCIGSTCAHVYASDGGACQCENVLDCDDGLPCTDQSCTDGVCVYEPAPGVTGCCTEALECDDGDPSTEDICVHMTCGNAPWGLCLVDAHCDDGDSCTTNTCVDGVCASALQDGCCHVDAQCADALSPTTDSCVAGDCVHTLGPTDACATTSDCPLPPPCLGVTCVHEICSFAFEYSPGCCLSAADCDDGDPCTVDDCGADLVCQHAPVMGPVIQIAWDFGDPALPGFTMTGGSGSVGWCTSLAMFVSPPRSLYFGDPAAGTFHTGGPVAGEARSALVQLPPSGPIVLEGATYIDVEPLFSRDLVWISVEAGGADVEVWNKEAVGGTTAQAWLPLTADLSVFAGQAVRLVFGFDSIDGVENFGEGVYFDDISLWWSCGI